MLNLLTGPVEIRRPARQAMLADAAPHRSRAFLDDVAGTQALLCRLTGAAHAQILLGSGTLANDVIAAQLSRRSGRGLVLSNGEFGERLVNHAARFGFDVEVLRWGWGARFDLAAIERRLAAGGLDWLWCVQLETSTGILNPVDWLRPRCEAHGVALCLDTISALGLVPLDLRRVRFASGVSGKGLRGYPGLAIVFYDHEVEPSPALPRYLDLGLYAVTAGVPFTHSSNLVGALHAALRGMAWPRHHAEIDRRSSALRARLRAAGFELVAPEPDAAPGIVSVALPPGCPSAAVSAAMEQHGVLLGAGSDYLRDRNWIQFSLMSRPSDAQLTRAVRTLAAVCRAVAPPAGAGRPSGQGSPRQVRARAYALTARGAPR